MIELRPFLDIGLGGIVTLVVLLILTDRLVWHQRLKAVEARQRAIEVERDRWQDMALRSLGVTERMTQPVEVVADVLTRLPDPAAEEEESP